MDNREKFEAWIKTKETEWGQSYGNYHELISMAWMECAEQKDAGIAESNKTWQEYVAQVMDDGGKQIRLKGDEVKRLTKEIDELKSVPKS